jgi:hypothetical protein
MTLADWTTAITHMQEWRDMFECWNETKTNCMLLELYICMNTIGCGQFVYNCISREEHI